MIDALGEILVKDEGNNCSQWLKFIFSSTECLCLSIWSKCSEFIETKTFIFKLIRDFSNYQNKVVGIELDGSEILWLLPGNKVVRATDLSCWNWKGHNVIRISRAQIICWLGSSYFRTFRIWFWKEYNHFERIHGVNGFDRLSSNFAQTFQE